MYQRDYLLNEARKFAQLLARLMGLKTEGNEDVFVQEFNQALQDEYDMELAQLLNLSQPDFKTRLQETDYSAEKLNALSQMLYVFAQPFAHNDDTILLLKKVLLIFDILEQKHHFDSFENIDKRKTIFRFLNTTYERP
ncbi:MAG: hypothetical protein V4592_06020 [Bacteroidota bacterium]